jgi:hypothetical protein
MSTILRNWVITVLVLMTMVASTPLGLVMAQEVPDNDRISNQTELLNTNLESLSDEIYRHRRFGGFALMGIGIGAGIIGAAVLNEADNDEEREVGYALIGGGVLAAGLSPIPLCVSGDAERLYQEYQEMLDDTPEQLLQKHSMGDRRFEELATKKRRNRKIGGSISLAVGVLALVFVDGTDAERFELVTAPIVGGVMGLLIKSDEERRYATYLKSRQDLFGADTGASVNWGIAPTRRGGLAAAIQVAF